MGTLQETPHSETHASLEVLVRHGVTREGLANLRGKMSGALLRQLAIIIQRGNCHKLTMLHCAFKVFTTAIGGKDYGSLASGFREKGILMTDEAEDLLQLKLKLCTRRFIILSAADMSAPLTPSFDQLSSQKWLNDWSEQNLLGYRLVLCREDAAPYLALSSECRWDVDTLLVATAPLESLRVSDGRTPLLALERKAEGVRIVRAVYTDLVVFGIEDD